MLLEYILVIVGLSLFEVISSIDNAIINSEVLSTMSEKSRKWFLSLGVLIAVFLVRGLLPVLILWSSNPNLGFLGVITAMLSSNPELVRAVEKSAPVLLIGGNIPGFPLPFLAVSRAEALRTKRASACTETRGLVLGCSFDNPHSCGLVCH